MVHKPSAALTAAFDLAFDQGRAPVVYQENSDEQIAALVQQKAGGVSQEEALAAVAQVRGFCEQVYRVAEAFRASAYGDTEERGQIRALAELSRQRPGLTQDQAAKALAAGLFWTAF